MNDVAYFLDFEFHTEQSVFFPRPETELLVEKALELLPREKPCAVLDVGTGSGNIAISLTKYLASSRIVASDISDMALSVATKNASMHAVADRIEFIKSNIFERMEGRYLDFFDMVISNPPYVSLEDLYLVPAEVKNDPYRALYGGKDGLDFYRAIIKKAPLLLKKGGVLIMEIGYDQAARIKGMLRDSGIFNAIELYKDYSGIDRIVKAEKWKSL